MTQELGPNQKKWLAALRSGEYGQCQGKLQQDDSYCCLGVAARLFDQPEGVIHGTDLIHRTKAMESLSLYSATGECRGGRSTGFYLVDLNDCEDYSFLQIADIIESDPSVYFNEPR